MQVLRLSAALRQPHSYDHTGAVFSPPFTHFVGLCMVAETDAWLTWACIPDCPPIPTSPALRIPTHNALLQLPLLSLASSVTPPTHPSRFPPTPPLPLSQRTSCLHQFSITCCTLDVFTVNIIVIYYISTHVLHGILAKFLYR